MQTISFGSTPRLAYRDIVSLIKRINTEPRDATNSIDATSGMRLEIQSDQSQNGERKVTLRKGTVAANTAFSQMTSELFTQRSHFKRQETPLTQVSVAEVDACMHEVPICATQSTSAVESSYESDSSEPLASI